MKLKNLPKNKSLIGTKIIIPPKLRKEQNIPKRVMYIKSGWNRGLWLSTGKGSRVYPLTFDSFKEIENLEVI